MPFRLKIHDVDNGRVKRIKVEQSRRCRVSMSITQSTRPCKVRGATVDEGGEREVGVLDIAGRLVIFVADFLPPAPPVTVAVSDMSGASMTLKFK